MCRASRPTPPAIPTVTPSSSRPPTLPNLNRSDWRQCEEFLYGVDLFNAGYWWECHEVLEGLWHAAGLGSPAGHALQAVIQCAAAHLKAHSGRPQGARRLLDHSLRHARWSGNRLLGLNLDRLVRDTRSFLISQAAEPAQLDLQF